MKTLKIEIICENKEEAKKAEKEILRFKRRLKKSLYKEISSEAIILNKESGKFQMIISRD